MGFRLNLWFRTWLADWEDVDPQKTCWRCDQRMNWNIRAVAFPGEIWLFSFAWFFSEKLYLSLFLWTGCATLWHIPFPPSPPFFFLFLSPWRRNTSNVKEHLAGVCFSLQEEWCLNDWSSFFPYHTPHAPAISSLLLWVDWQVENVEKFWNILSLVEKLRRGNLCDLVIELALNWIDLEKRWRHRVLSVTRQFLLISHSCGCCLNPELQTVQSVPW